MKRSYPAMVAVALLLGACSNNDQAPVGPTAPMPAKTTAADYTPPVIRLREGPVDSVNAQGEIAPFGYAQKLPVEVPPAPAPAAVAATAAIAATGSATSTEFATHCAACHGADAMGVQGLGANLHTSDFVASNSEAELVAFLKAGRGLDDPANETGIPMPAFAWMQEAQLEEIAGYLKSL